MGHLVRGKRKDWEARNSGSMKQEQEMDRAGTGSGCEAGKKGIG
jgi:hypothetical protein